MTYQAVFQRYEIKYLITQAQKELVLRGMEPYMVLDEYGRTTIRNIYFDTADYRLVRRSIERPVFKEKLRVRSYGRATAESIVFVELKRKYRDIVYKRRLPLCEEQAMEWTEGVCPCGSDTQISHEIDYFLSYYGPLYPTAFLSYEREAYCSRNGDSFRVTFDDTILCRQTDLSLEADVYGEPLLKDGLVLMEIKCAGGIPLWMTGVLSKEHIYKTSFSKYGTAYQTVIWPQLRININKECSVYA